LAIVLLVGAGLLVRSHGALRRVDRGYTADGVLTFELGLPRLAYPTREAATRAHNEILTRVRALPGVTSAGATTCLPLCGSWAGEEWRSPERPTPPGENPPIGATRRISAGYLETLRLRLVAGRYLTAEDEAARSGAAVVSEQLAARLWPGEDPIGRHLYHGMPARPQDWYTVVGVVANTAVRELTDQPVSMAYLPLLHVDSTEGPAPYLMSVVLRTSVPPASVVDAARGAVLAIDPTLPMARVRTMQSIVVSAESRTAFARTMLLVAAAVALFLGVIGTYGVLAWVVNRRRPEFGIRMALGARPADISRLVAAHSIRIVGSGLAIGVVMAAMVTRLMTALLHGVTPLDPIAFGMSVALLMAAGAAATWLPARRASLVSPVEALKSD
jgi:predicted permease